MTPSDAMIARMAIQYRMGVYNTCGDRGKIDELAEAFAEDGVLELETGVLTGRAAIVGHLSGIAAGEGGIDLRFSRHHLTTSRVEFDDDTTARAWTYFTVIRAGIILQAGVYVDRFVRHGDDWLILHRRVKIEFTRSEEAAQ